MSRRNDFLFANDYVDMNRLRQRILSLVQPNKLSKTSIIRRNDLLNRLTKLLPFFRIGLIVLGFIYFLILPTNLLSREHYVSENALQPAQASSRPPVNIGRTLTKLNEIRSILIGIGLTFI